MTPETRRRLLHHDRQTMLGSSKSRNGTPELSRKKGNERKAKNTNQQPPKGLTRLDKTQEDGMGAWG